jgi:hypothetical protein
MVAAWIKQTHAAWLKQSKSSALENDSTKTETQNVEP